MGLDGDSSDDLETAVSKERSARLSRDAVFDDTRFYKRLKQKAPDFPYRPTACSEDTLIESGDAIDFYMKRLGPAIEANTKVIRISTDEHPSTISMATLADIAADKLNGSTLPEDKYVCLRFSQV